MELKDMPDFGKYKDKFTNSAFATKISSIAKRSGAKLVYAALVLYYTLESDRVAIKDKALVIGALGYLITPFDLVPDAIPIAGLGDDLSVLLFVLHKVWWQVPDSVKAKAEERLSKWFDKDEIKGLENLFDKDPDNDPV